MEQLTEDVLKKINERLVALEIVHTRYRGPDGKRGEKGEQGPAGKDGINGKDATVEERNAFREELNKCRAESYGHKQLREELDRAQDNDSNGSRLSVECRTFRTSQTRNGFAVASVNAKRLSLRTVYEESSRGVADALQMSAV